MRKHVFLGFGILAYGYEGSTSSSSSRKSGESFLEISSKLFRVPGSPKVDAPTRADTKVEKKKSEKTVKNKSSVEKVPKTSLVQKSEGEPKREHVTVFVPV